MKKKNEIIEVLDLASVKFDICKTWPLEKESVKVINCIHKMEYIPSKDRLHFIEEAWRVLEVGGTMSVVVCYWSSPRSIQDPLVEFPPYCEQSFLYFNKGWREQNQLPAIKADFDFTYGYQVDPETAGRSTESQTFWIKHYINTATDLQLTLTKRA